jgi:hypothetical protein
MTARAVTGEEWAGANQVSLMVLYSMIVVLSLEIGDEAVESNPAFFLGVSPGLLYLTDHARVHRCSFAAV